MALRAQAIWSVNELSDRDRAWIGTVNRLADIPDFMHVILHRKTMVSYPGEAPARITGPESMEYWGELASIWAPIVAGDEVLGLLELAETRAPKVFTEADVALVERLAQLAALALRNARDSRAAEARNRQLTALIDSSRAMTSTLDLEEVLDIVCRQAAHALDSAASYIYEYDPEGRTMIWLAEYQRDPAHSFEEPLGTVYPIDDLPQDLDVVERRRPVQVSIDDDDLHPTARDQLLDWEETSSLMVPLIVADDIVGALEVSETHRVRRFSDDEVSLCKALGEQAGVAIRNAQLYRRLQEQKAIIERQATTDGLTGLFNHRHFWDRLHAEVARARRYGQPVSLLMLDLDDFKAVNDRFGHPAGDRLLRAVGEVLLAQVRQSVDVPARYGGEEFAVVLPSTESVDETGALDGAVTTGERIREAVEALELEVGSEKASITVSIGVATLPVHASDADDLVSKADKALYGAKSAGKNRVEVYPPPAPSTPSASPRQ